MCRIGVLLVAVVLLEFTWAGTQSTDGRLVQRFKRSPGYYGHHRHWPPPPDCWPPPPRDYWPPPPGQPPRPPPGPEQRTSEQEPFSRYSNEPCTDNCGGKSSGSGSISNAKSGTGDAIAVAVAKGQ